VNKHDCLPSQRCDNTIGSYHCIRFTSCGTGYTLNAQTGQCEGKFYDDKNRVSTTRMQSEEVGTLRGIEYQKCVLKHKTTYNKELLIQKYLNY
jgi:hypothetical protein